MAYNTELAERVRQKLDEFQYLKIVEKNMFGGLAFMINDKMCINVSGDRLMCRFDPKIQEEITKKIGYQKMIMRGKEYNGYCYVSSEGFRAEEDFNYWVNICLKFNEKAKSSKKSKKKK